jgi:His-Xaa-Ser system protein HxsD
MTLKFSKELYLKEALIKAAFQFTEKAYLYLSQDADYYYIEIIPKGDMLPSNFEHEFENEMLSQTVHSIVSHQTSQLRSIIMGRALSSTMVLEKLKPQEDPTEIESFDLDQILKDWFEQNEDKI